MKVGQVRLFTAAALLSAGIASMFVYGLSFLVPALGASSIIPTVLELFAALGGGSFALRRQSQQTQ